MKLTPFPTTAPENPKWDSGGRNISPSHLATALFKSEVPGAMLCCYMLRRFGWPNEGSDDYKNLMSWCLTTPISGLFLSITPYLGSDGRDETDPSNLHFSLRCTEEVGRKLGADPGRESYFRRHSAAVMIWWETKGIKLYAWGMGTKEGDEDELVHKYSDHTKDKALVYGLWRRTPRIKGRRDIPKQAQMVEWWLGELLKSKHPEVKLPQMTAAEIRNRHTPFAKRCAVALQRTMLDLLRPTNVRDVSFNCFGKTEQGHSGAISPRLIREPPADYWHGAGNTPAYWYSKEAKKEREALKAK